MSLFISITHVHTMCVRLLRINYKENTEVQFMKKLFNKTTTLIVEGSFNVVSDMSSCPDQVVIIQVSYNTTMMLTLLLWRLLPL